MSNPTGKNQYSGSGAGNARNLTAKLLSNAAKKASAYANEQGSQEGA
jgi:hypothetical protein